MYSTMNLSRGKVPFLLIVGIYCLCIFLVGPQGEFPLNDDWSYTRSAFSLGTRNILCVDEWSAMSLIGQAIYGGALVKLFGPSFLLLRISTLVLSCGTALLLWALLRRIDVRPNLAWIVVLAWIFNPIQFCLAFTFMTEVPFLFFVMLALFLYTLYLRSGSFWQLAAWSAACGYAFLIRQTALLFAGPLIFGLFLERSSGFRARLGRAGLAAAVFLPFPLAYYAWVAHRGGMTPATLRKFELLRHLTAEQFLGNSLGILFYLSFLLLPVLACLIPSFYRGCKDSGLGTRLACLSAWTATAAFGLWWFQTNYRQTNYLPSAAYHAQMPILLNVLYDTGLGPVTLDPTYYGPPAMPSYPVVWQGITIAVALGLVVMGSYCSTEPRRLLSNAIGGGAWRPLLTASGLMVLGAAGFEIVFSHLQEGGLFDRHILIAALPMSLLLAIPQRTQTRRGPAGNHGACAGGAALILILSAWFCVTATHDYLAWNRIRWELGTRLLEQKVDPLTLSAGFEFNAWHNYDTFRRRGNIGKVYHWWYDKRDYLIAMNPVPGYRILREKEFFSWLHRINIPLYVLRKDG